MKKYTEVIFYNDEDLLNYLTNEEIEELSLDVDWQTWTITNQELNYPIPLISEDVIISVELSKNLYDRYENSEEYMRERYNLW